MLRLLVLAIVCSAMYGADLRYWIEPCDSLRAACRAGDPELAKWALSAWQSASSGKLRLTPASGREKAHLRIFWSGGRDGLYGEARPIFVDGIRGAEVYVLPPDARAASGDSLLRDVIVYLTCVHESGHALGLQHTSDFADIMYNFQYGGDIAEYFGRYRRLLKSRSEIPGFPGISPGDIRRLLGVLSN
jgi:hypothetical protein